ncbi:NAD(P)/FAD-dependent oxidoreductase [Polycladidibacter hongkongensis]|uniref:NAD(P)/FAD-dependent oxidoreductase n=1 Tax=Polycladidibacter hongkongensis TaxID=1647556 RepID=UPI0008307C42|nr:FAD-dependent oxidoreductase [Pseudovibrio hongkongensis]
MKIAVVGSGISGVSAAWLLSKAHQVDLFEKEQRLGGHAHTRIVQVQGQSVAVDSGFIVFNERTYLNLTALFGHLGVQTVPSSMSFSVSDPRSGFEYSGNGLAGLFAQKRNYISPRFWRMLYDLRRFYITARAFGDDEAIEAMTLGEYLEAHRYSAAFIQGHLLPMGAAIWSMSVQQMRDFPLLAFLRFFKNHGLLQFTQRPQWRTVLGGSHLYLSKLSSNISGKVRKGVAVRAIERRPHAVRLLGREGELGQYDHVVLAGHSDQSLRMLKSGSGASALEERLLSAIPYQDNEAYMHMDERLMPQRRAAWAAWNSICSHKTHEQTGVCVSYWMNALQPLTTRRNIFVTINPPKKPREELVLAKSCYAHPLFTSGAMTAQRDLWQLQGRERTWFCGAYFGHGFHEDGLQAGLAVAEALGGVKRPWDVDCASGRIHGADLFGQQLAEAAE